MTRTFQVSDGAPGDAYGQGVEVIPEGGKSGGGVEEDEKRRGARMRERGRMRG